MKVVEEEERTREVHERDTRVEQGAPFPNIGDE
jgi:hypothetical protein